MVRSREELDSIKTENDQWSDRERSWTRLKQADTVRAIPILYTITDVPLSSCFPNTRNIHVRTYHPMHFPCSPTQSRRDRGTAHNSNGGLRCSRCSLHILGTTH